jgi:lysophospholipase
VTNQATADDPLNFAGEITAHMGNEVVKIGIAATETAPSFWSNLLLLHGGADRVCTLAGSETVFRKCSSTDKRLCIYPGLKHELLMEPLGRRDVIADVLAWTAARIQLFNLQKQIIEGI